MSHADAHGELEHLVSMANDIARNLGHYPDPAAKTADHLRRFWAPSMRALIQAHVAAGGTGLADHAIEAVKRLPP